MKIERELAVLSDWTPDEIKMRQSRFSDWAKNRWFVKPVEPLPPVPEGSTVEKLRAKAERDGWLKEFDSIRECAKKLGLDEKAQKHCISYKPKHNWNLTAFSVYTYPNAIYIPIKPKHFLKFPNISEERIQEILGEKIYWWMPTSEMINEFISCLNILISEIDKRKGDDQSL